MTDTTLVQSWFPAQVTAGRPSRLDGLAHRTNVLRRRARRNRYLALIGQSPHRYSWFEIMFQSMRGR